MSETENEKLVRNKGEKIFFFFRNLRATCNSAYFINEISITAQLNSLLLFIIKLECNFFFYVLILQYLFVKYVI